MAEADGYIDDDLKGIFDLTPGPTDVAAENKKQTIGPEIGKISCDRAIGNGALFYAAKR